MVMLSLKIVCKILKKKWLIDCDIPQKNFNNGELCDKSVNIFINNQQQQKLTYISQLIWLSLESQLSRNFEKRNSLIISKILMCSIHN